MRSRKCSTILSNTFYRYSYVMVLTCNVVDFGGIRYPLFSSSAPPSRTERGEAWIKLKRGGDYTWGVSEGVIVTHRFEMKNCGVWERWEEEVEREREKEGEGGSGVSERERQRLWEVRTKASEVEDV